MSLEQGSMPAIPLSLGLRCGESGKRGSEVASIITVLSLINGVNRRGRAQAPIQILLGVIVNQVELNVFISPALADRRIVRSQQIKICPTLPGRFFDTPVGRNVGWWAIILSRFLPVLRAAR